MTFLTDETSLLDGNPIELHLFVSGQNRWGYTSSSKIGIIYNGDTYIPETISRSKNRITTNALKNEMRLTVPEGNAMVAPYTVAPYEHEVIYTGYKGHNGDYVQQWYGVVVNVKFKGTEATIIVSPFATRLKRSGLIRRFSRLCPYPLYSGKCGVNANTYKASGTVSSVIGLVVNSSTFSGYSDRYFDGGWLDANGYTRMIVNHVGASVTLATPIPNLAAGMAFDAYRGCNHTLSECDTIFGKSLDFGGCPYLPDKNPFIGDPIV
jgi:uncharacterized phage protein (TIGR02218 family)